MEKGLRQFVRRILLIHLALLALLLAVVSGAARHLYKSARSQAIRQAQERQSLLAAAIGVVHGMPLFEVLALRQVVRGDGSSFATGPGGAPVDLASPLAVAFDGLAVEAGALVFSGRNGVQPLSISAVRHHVLRRRERG